MTAMIRFYSLNSKRLCAQFEEKELGYDFMCSFKAKQKRRMCAYESGQGR